MAETERATEAQAPPAATPEEVYHRHAAATPDRALKVLSVMHQTNPELPQAAVAGMMMAMVQYYAGATRDPELPIITRDVVVNLTPVLHRSAEQVVKTMNSLDNRVQTGNPSEPGVSRVLGRQAQAEES